MSVLSQLSKKGQMVLLGVLVLIMCVIYYVYMISPIRTELQSINSDIQRLEQEVAEGEAVRGELEVLKAEVARQQARLDYLRQVLPEKKETAEIIRQVQEMAEQSNLDIRSFTPRPTINNEFYEDWPILISLEGTFDSLGVFFESIAGFTRIINVENISIEALDPDEATNERTLSATCTATTFVYLEAPAASTEGEVE